MSYFIEFSPQTYEMGTHDAHLFTNEERKAQKS